jgi:hypothetical protein
MVVMRLTMSPICATALNVSIPTTLQMNLPKSTTLERAVLGQLPALCITTLWSTYAPTTHDVSALNGMM